MIDVGLSQLVRCAQYEFAFQEAISVTTQNGSAVGVVLSSMGLEGRKMFIRAARALVTMGPPKKNPGALALYALLKTEG